MRSIFLFLIVIIVFLIVWTIIKGRREHMAKKQAAQQQNKQDNRMVQCHVTGTYLPEDQAFVYQGKYFSSKALLQQFIEENKK